MKSPIALILLFTLALYTNARKDRGEYWREVMKDEPMPKAIQHLMPRSHREKSDCHKSSFEPRPNVSSYHDDDVGVKQERDFEPKSNASSYHDDNVGLKQKKVFEPRPNLSSYHDDDADLKQEKEFDPRPNVSVYHD
ncbi:organ-specific protein S2-like [Solanum dulcamara]|uniref:organ-specific protein S2-like n=1 Tax=Solanum dulcamara TaxID=45834 RepID=UPI002486A3AF|nr:organ-specific protein S2-like [Solanum dulcamara]